MKKKSLNQKLLLNKKTITNLNTIEMNNVAGGIIPKTGGHGTEPPEPDTVGTKKYCQSYEETCTCRPSVKHCATGIICEE